MTFVMDDYTDYNYYEKKRHTKKPSEFNSKSYSDRTNKKSRKKKSRDLQKFTDKLKKSY